MDQTRSSLLPNIVFYLRNYPSKCITSRSQLILRVYRTSPYLLTDGFFYIQCESLRVFPQNTFVRVKHWELNLSAEDLSLKVLDFQVLGTEIMSDYQMKPIKNELQVRVLMIPAFTAHLKSTISDTPMTEILEITKLIEQYE